MKIHAFTLDRGGCFYYRVRQPLTALRELGHWTSWGSGVDLETWERAGVLVAQYLHTEQTAEHWTRWAESGRKLCVFEADDDIFSVHTNPAHGNAYDNPETLPRMIRMLEAAHLVTVTTPQLAKVYGKYNPHVVVLRNCVPEWLVDLPPARRPVLPKGRFRIGYTGSASHAEDFTAWSPVLDRWMRRESHRTSLVLFGHNGRPKGMPLTYRVTHRPWEKDTAAYLRSMAGAFDVGVAFVRGTEFDDGKSGIKAQEYAGLGIPSIATDCDQYRDVIVHGETGFLVRTERDWLNAFGELAFSDGVRARMGENARELARQEFLQLPRAWQWEEAYRVAAERIGVRL